MSQDQATRAEKTMTETEKLAVTIACAVAFAYAVALAQMFVNHLWILDESGRPALDDFLVFWAAGKLALKDGALAVYDAYRLHAAEAAAAGHNFTGWLVWSYPPLFLFVAAALANLPYGIAFAVWCAGSLGLYAVAASAIAGRRIAFLVACAMPWVLRVLMIGQNGLLTSALAGFSLLNLERRPALAGLLLGLMSYKPQFGILFPLALLAGGYWRAFAWAAAGTLFWNGLAAFVFGASSYAACLNAIFVTTNTHLVHNAIGWDKLQSVYGFARFLGADGNVAWAAQAATTLGLALGVVAFWRSSAPYALKAAFLAASSALATPYVFVDDLPILAVSMAFLFRDRAFDKTEIAFLAAAVPCVYLSVGLALPTATLAGVVLLALTLRRLYVAAPWGLISPSWVTEATSLPSSE